MSHFNFFSPGVLLHYDEVHLQDVYFLDPQWLCDMLANIITIREINGLAKSGQFKGHDRRRMTLFAVDLFSTFDVGLISWDVSFFWNHSVNFCSN